MCDVMHCILQSSHYSHKCFCFCVCSFCTTLCVSFHSAQYVKIILKFGHIYGNKSLPNKLLLKVQALCYFNLIVVQYSALRIYGTLVLSNCTFLLKMRKKYTCFQTSLPMHNVACPIQLPQTKIDINQFSEQRIYDLSHMTNSKQIFLQGLSGN